jgi:hypothetical protein
MPVVLRVAGYKFFFYQADVANEPPHVHVNKEGNEANFEEVICGISNGLSRITCNSF